MPTPPRPRTSREPTAMPASFLPMVLICVPPFVRFRVAGSGAHSHLDAEPLEIPPGPLGRAWDLADHSTANGLGIQAVSQGGRRDSGWSGPMLLVSVRIAGPLTK